MLQSIYTCTCTLHTYNTCTMYIHVHVHIVRTLYAVHACYVYFPLHQMSLVLNSLDQFFQEVEPEVDRMGGEGDTGISLMALMAIFNKVCTLSTPQGSLCSKCTHCTCILIYTTCTCMYIGTCVYIYTTLSW